MCGALVLSVNAIWSQCGFPSTAGVILVTGGIRPCQGIQAAAEGFKETQTPLVAAGHCQQALGLATFYCTGIGAIEYLLQTGLSPATVARDAERVTPRTLFIIAAEAYERSF